jgi:hypothetical protein
MYPNHYIQLPSLVFLLLESGGGGVPSLTELAAREVAASIPFELVEVYHPPVPEQLQLRIAFWSFPELEEDIRLYSCLANGSADEFNKGEHLFKTKAVKDPLQIGTKTDFRPKLKPGLSPSACFVSDSLISKTKCVPNCTCCVIHAFGLSRRAGFYGGGVRPPLTPSLNACMCCAHLRIKLCRNTIWGRPYWVQKAPSGI